MDGANSGAKKAPRSRSGSLSLAEPRQRTSSTSSVRDAGMTATTRSLMDETNRLAATAAAAAKKAQQRKVTDFLVDPKKGVSGGAGELPSGPCGLTNPEGPPRTPVASAAASTSSSMMSTTAATAASSSLVDGVASVLHQMRQMQQQNLREDAAATRREGAQGPDDEEGWQVWTNRKSRRVGEETDVRTPPPRQARGETPFRLSGQAPSSSKGYYTSAYRRDQAALDHRGTNRSSAAAALTDQQWHWFKKRLCLSCGAEHQVKDCPDLARRDEGFALLRAAFACPPDMRPGGAGQGRGRDPPRGGRRTSTVTPGTGAAAAAAAPPSSSTSQPATAAAGASKRPRNQEEQGSSGFTPEAKKAKPFTDAVKASLTLYVREKDGTALTEERFLSLKTSFAYYVEDMMSKNKDPPICSGRWLHNRSVVKIPMAGEMDLLWMRCFLDKAYLVQNEAEFNRSKGKIYVAYLRDRLEPELTGMRSDKLASFVKYFKRQAKINGLFDLRMAAKTPKGKAIHLIMDEEAEGIFIREGCKIPFASAGWIAFEDRVEYVARIKSKERQRLKPKASTLEKGLLEQEMDVDKMTMGEDEEVVEVGRATPRSAAAAAAVSAAAAAAAPAANPALSSTKGVGLDEVREMAKAYKEDIAQGKFSKEMADALMMEKTGLKIDDVLPPTRRTISTSAL